MIKTIDKYKEVDAANVAQFKKNWKSRTIRRR